MALSPYPQYVGEADVATPNPEWSQMFERWRLPLALRTGTSGMQDGLYGTASGFGYIKAPTEWLPMYPQEETERYRIRRRATPLFAGLDDTIERLVAKPFVRPVTTDGPLPARLEELIEDCDTDGSTLTQFGARLLSAALTTGMTHLLVDYPAIGGSLDLETETRLGVNPYLVHIPAECLFGWKWGVRPNGERFLRQIRYREVATEEVGEWGLAQFDRVHVYDFVTSPEEGVGMHSVWEQDPKSLKWLMAGEPVSLSYVGVPIVTYYTSWSAPMESSVPLQGIADLNLAHYQVSSEHRNVLTACGVAMLGRTGISKEESDENVVISPFSVLSATPPDAKLFWVEHSGAGVEAIERYLTQLEGRMESLGMSPLQQRAARLTATSRVLDESKSETVAQAWVRDLEEVLTRAFRIAGNWVREEVSDDFTVRIFNEFGVSDSTPDELEQLLKARESKQIDHETYLTEIRRRSLISEDSDIDAIMAAVEAEGPDLGSLPPVPGFGDGPDSQVDTSAAQEAEEQENAA